MLMNSSKHTQVARRKLMNIQTYAKSMHQNTTETKAFLLDYISTLLKRFDDFCLTKYIEQIHSPFFHSWR